VATNLMSRRLIAASPLRNPEMIAAFERYERMSISELDAAWERVNGAFRVWVESPANAGHPIAQAPQYWDRIAIGTLQECRTWSE
jgi:hypothetical protein